MTKKIVFTLLALMPLLKLTAQQSETELIFRSTSNSYEQLSSIVRNYDVTTNVIMQYGHFTSAGSQNVLRDGSSFMIQNTTTGGITHIFDLPNGYQVNDVQFVTLRKIDGVTTQDFCVFCGTRTQLDDVIQTPTLPGETPQYQYQYSKHGFAGFFAMNEALSPSASFTAKVRDVEKTRELYKMVCYAEEHGTYYSHQNSFLDNAVLDIIGLDDTISAPSCFCRARFYPGYNGGIRWDNDMRYNSNEVLTDIAMTDDYVVTSSHSATGNDQWIRYSEKEDHWVTGGLQLNNYVYSIDSTLLTIHNHCNSSFNIYNLERPGTAKICHTRHNGIELSYRVKADGFYGLLNCQYNYDNGTLQFLRGAYYKCLPSVYELIYMPRNNATAITYKESNQDMVTIISWERNNNCYYPTKQYWEDNIDIHSITLQNRGGYEHLFWSGMKRDDLYSPLYLLMHRVILGYRTDPTCHNTFSNSALPVTIGYVPDWNPMTIAMQFDYNDITYPVMYISFNPHDIESDVICSRL